MPTTTILDRLMNHLAAQALTRKPSDPGAGGRPWLPPFWRAPAEGAIAPGDKGRDGNGALLPGAGGTEADDGLVITADKTGEISPSPGEGYAQRDIVDLRLRGRAVPPILELAAAIALELAPRPYGVRYSWDMAGLFLIESRQWRPLQKIQSGTQTGTPAGQGTTYVVAYLFEYHR